MKGVILAGGKGSRLRPFTYSGAKQLVPVANVPVLHFPVKQLVACGITEIAMVVGDTENQIREAMGDGSAFGARFTYVRQAEPLGIAHGLGMCAAFAGEEPVVMYLGDNILVGGIDKFVTAFGQSTSAASVVLKEVGDPRAFGVAVLDGERVASVVEKPAEPPSNLAVIGVYAFRPPVFEVIRGLKPSARGELEIADAINGLIVAGHRVDTAVTAEHWIDTGKMEDMLAANRVVLEFEELAISELAHVHDSRCSGRVGVADAAEVSASELAGPVVIGRGARITGSRIGPNVSIGDGCTVVNSKLSNCIVMSDSVVMDCPEIRDSMLGRNVDVRRAPEGASLVLGDHSSFAGRA
jgi:glucose-1-phosphate thymidylyltransferase